MAAALGTMAAIEGPNMAGGDAESTAAPEQAAAAELEAATGAEAAATRATGSPVEGLPRTGSALKTDLYHAFPDIVDNSAGLGTATKLRPGVTLYQVEGSYNGVAGRFEWIVDKGAVTHRMFVPGGQATGVPINP